MMDAELSLLDLKGLDEMDVMSRIRAIERGVLASDARDFATGMGLQPTRFLQIIGAPRTTFARKNAPHLRLSIAQSERAVWLAQEIGHIQTIVLQSGNPVGFDAAAWLGGWIDRPCQALANQRPADLLATDEGRQMLALVIQRMQTGAYA